MSVELAFAVVGVADLCLKYGKIVVELYTSYKGADSEVNERVLLVESYWKRTTIQLDFLSKVWTTLDDEHQRIQTQVLQILSNKLTTTISALGKIQKKSKNSRNGGSAVIGVKKLKYALVKDSLDTTIRDLENWQKLFDPSWFLIMKISSHVIDQELEQNDQQTNSLSTAKGIRIALRVEPEAKGSIFLPMDEFSSMEQQVIPLSGARVLLRPGSSKLYIVDSVQCDPAGNIALLTKDVRDLARRLSQTDPWTVGLLSCRGAVRMMSSDRRSITSFDFVFRMPDGTSNPQSLRMILMSANSSHSLSDRFTMAKQLARSVSYVHTYGFVHKNIRPETILNLQNHKSTLGSIFLLGFERFRLADGRTLRTGDSAWEKDLYRFPGRQGLNPEEDYKMQHDIYSLGVCLLEIGLWQSFVIYNDNGTPKPAQILRVPDMDNAKAARSRAALIKTALINLAKENLPQKMGDKYTDITLNCLTCLDEDNLAFGDQTEFKDADGILIGVGFIEKILLQLEEINV